MNDRRNWQFGFMIIGIVAALWGCTEEAHIPKSSATGGNSTVAKTKIRESCVENVGKTLSQISEDAASQNSMKGVMEESVCGMKFDPKSYDPREAENLRKTLGYIPFASGDTVKFLNLDPSRLSDRATVALASIVTRDMTNQFFPAKVYDAFITESQLRKYGIEMESPFQIQKTSKIAVSSFSMNVTQEGRTYEIEMRTPNCFVCHAAQWNRHENKIAAMDVPPKGTLIVAGAPNSHVWLKPMIADLCNLKPIVDSMYNEERINAGEKFIFDMEYDLHTYFLKPLYQDMNERGPAGIQTGVGWMTLLANPKKSTSAVLPIPTKENRDNPEYGPWRQLLDHPMYFSDGIPWWYFKWTEKLFHAGLADSSDSPHAFTTHMRLFTGVPYTIRLGEEETHRILSYYRDYFRQIVPPSYNQMTGGALNAAKIIKGYKLYAQIDTLARADREPNVRRVLACKKCHGDIMQEGMELTGSYDWPTSSEAIAAKWIYAGPLQGRVETGVFNPHKNLEKFADRIAEVNHSADKYRTNIRLGDGMIPAPIDGILAAPPFMPNGSVPEFQSLMFDDLRPAKWALANRGYDTEKYGANVVTANFEASHVVYDTTRTGRSNAGHKYGAALSWEELDALAHFLWSVNNPKKGRVLNFSRLGQKIDERVIREYVPGEEIPLAPRGENPKYNY